MKKTVGFIGCGNMAEAIIEGMIESNLIVCNKIIASARSEQTVARIKSKYNIKTSLDNTEVARTSDILVLAIKPNIYGMIIEEIKDHIKEETIIIGIAAGISIEYIENRLEGKFKVIKAMPNTPAMVGEGMTGIAVNDKVNKEDLAEIIDIFNSFGKVEIINEELMDAVTAVSGSSPAYIYILIEAMADGAVLEGMSRELAYKFAAQAVLGAAKMVLETGEHPGKLKDNVCSPKGTTIEAVASLEEHGFRTAVIKAMEACVEKSRKMTNI